MSKKSKGKICTKNQNKFKIINYESWFRIFESSIVHKNFEMLNFILLRSININKQCLTMLNCSSCCDEIFKWIKGCLTLMNPIRVLSTRDPLHNRIGLRDDSWWKGCHHTFSTYSNLRKSFELSMIELMKVNAITVR